VDLRYLANVGTVRKVFVVPSHETMSRYFSLTMVRLVRSMLRTEVGLVACRYLPSEP
jgi:hypothetical protein